ncbi:rRNA-processing protein and EBNA1-binding protein ebp2 [Pseudocyphellaria aurata]|nr:rRNA-processing protein and EBNA1-binding protein ebp2 [Pseudocyphellaria aurata]
MAKKSRLLAALDAHKGKDYKLEKQKKFQKQAANRKRNSNPPHQNAVTEVEDFRAKEVDRPLFQPEAERDDLESSESEDVRPIGIDISHIDDSDSESEGSLDHPQRSQESSVLSDREGEGDKNEGVDEDNGIPLSDIDSLPDEEVADIVPHQRLTINNKAALLKAHISIALPMSKLPFSERQTISSTEKIPISDVNDDLNRELAFYKQSLDAVNEARALLKREGLPFSRPTDYFAEMVKSDEHMEKIKQKMTDEAANKKAAAEARKQRDLRKFGKQVQIAKLQERDKSKRETLDKINLLKRKRRNTGTVTTQEQDLFDVALEDASKVDKSSGSARDGIRGRAQNKRQRKDDKFGFGGKKRFSKSGDATSSADLRGFSVKKMKGQRKASQRPGKSRRAKQFVNGIVQT